MFQDRCIFFSYCNQDNALALRIGKEMLNAGYPLWHDRLCLAPTAHWYEELLHHQERADAALILVTETYLSSDYCLDELHSFLTRKIPLIAIRCHQDIFLDAQDFVAIIELENAYQEDEFVAALRQVFSAAIQLDFSKKHLTEEQQYLYQLIANLEQSFVDSLSARLACLNQVGFTWLQQKMRPHCHSPEAWLVDANYRLYDNENISLSSHDVIVSNLLDWLEVRSQLAILGESASGKTTVLKYLTKLAAYKRLENGIQSPLPYYLDLSAWQGKETISAYIQRQWSLNSNILELLRLSGAVLFLDGISDAPVNADIVRNALLHLLNVEDIPYLIFSLDSRGIQLLSNHALPIIELSELSQSQLDKIASASFVLAEIASSDLQSCLAQIMSASIRHPEKALVGFAAFGDVLPALWRQIESLNNKRFNLENLQSALDNLAYLSYKAGTKSYSQQFALKAMGNDLLIQLAQYLGILIDAGDNLSFVLPKLRAYLAACSLLDDGIYTKLSHPKFDSNGNRLEGIWDEVIVASSQLVPEDTFALFIEMIADVDPYLAYICAQANGASSFAVESIIVQGLIEPKRQDLRSKTLSKAIINQSESPDQMIALMLATCDDATLGRADAALELLLQFDLPADKTEDLSDMQKLLLYVQSALMGYGEKRVEAIESLATQKPQLAKLVLTKFSPDEPVAVLESFLRTVDKLNSKALLPQVYSLLLHKNHDLRGLALATLSKFEPRVKQSLLMFLEAENALDKSLIEAISSQSGNNLQKILYYILGTFGYAQSHSLELQSLDGGEGLMLRRTLELLSDKMTKLRSRDAFQAFADEILQETHEKRHKDPEGLASQLEGRIRPASLKSEESHVAASTIPEHLMRLIKHEDWLMRLQAVKQLAHYPVSLSCERLLQLAKDEDSQVRIAALEALNHAAHEPQILEVFIGALEDEEAQVVDTAADYLKLLKPNITAELTSKLENVPLYNQAVILDLLGALAKEDAVESLVPYLKDESEPWLWDCKLGDIAAKALLNIGTIEALNAVQESGRMNYPEASEILLPGIDELSEDDSSISYFARLLDKLSGDDWASSQEAARKLRSKARDLRDKENTNIAQFLAEQMIDADWTVRWTILESLAWLKNPCVKPYLLLCLDDENWTVLIASIRAIVELQASELAPNLVSLLFHQETAVREACAEALGELKNPQVLSALSEAISDEDQFVRLAVVRAFIAIDHKPSFRELAKVVKDPYSHIRWYAIRALAELADPKHLPIIVPMLKDKKKPAWEKYNISEYAEAALQRMGTNESKEVLKKWGRIKSSGRS